MRSLISETAQRLLEPFDGETIPLEAAGGALGFTARQTARLGDVFGTDVPEAALDLLCRIGHSERFGAVARALSAKEKRPRSTEDAADRLGAELEETLESAQAQGRCAGWEIDELVSVGRGVFGIKIGIYPWGKTIQYGTERELRRMVADILAEIAEAPAKCPFCAAEQPISASMQACECGTRFFVRGAWSVDEGAPGEDCWPALRWALGVIARGRGRHLPGCQGSGRTRREGLGVPR